MSIYYDLWNILNEYFFGNAIMQGDGTVESLAITLCALIGSIFLVSLPFILVYRIIRIL